MSSSHVCALMMASRQYDTIELKHVQESDWHALRNKHGTLGGCIAVPAYEGSLAEGAGLDEDLWENRLAAAAAKIQ
eukprot:scaffold14446_cov22-Tisochrysis_lutea.AAC.3